MKGLPFDPRIPYRMAHIIRATLLLTTLASISRAAETIDIGTRLEWFADSFLVETFDGAELRMHSPVPAETVLAFDKPWEGIHCGYVTVLQDGARYRLYYRGMPAGSVDGTNDEVTCYAESADGIHFEKPNLGLFEVNGSRENNVILANAAPFSHNFAPFLDTRPGVAATERFKALVGIMDSGLHAFVSADGVRWEQVAGGPVLTKGVFDSQNVAFWSEHEQRYICYYRTWSEGGFSGIRTVSRATSTDFKTWGEDAWMTFGNTPLEHLYTNQTQPYFRAAHLYVGIAARFMPGRRIVSEAEMRAMGGEAAYSGDCSDAVLLTSRGGNAYDRTFMEGFIRPGLGLNNWTSRTNYPACGIVPTGEDEMSMYVQRNYGQKSHHLQRLTMRIDGFGSLHAGYAGGRATSRPIKFSGNILNINVSTSAAGSVRIGLLDADEKAIEGFTLEDCDEIVGDRVVRGVSWKGITDISALKGKTVQLAFELKDADVFSIVFHE